MPVIVEENEANVLDDAEFAQLLNLPEPDESTGSNDVVAAEPAYGEEGRPYSALCPLHPDSTEILGQLGDAGFIRPAKPCDYCRSRRLDCYLQRGEPHCTPCASLFRECSLSKSHTLEASNNIEHPPGTFLDTLHVVDEDVAKDQGTLTGIKPLKSKVGINDDAPGSSKRNGIRFPRHAVKTLRDWLDRHMDNPYPTEQEKAHLEEMTELKPNQIANWLANARRRKKVTERTMPKPLMSPSLRPSTSAIPIPGSKTKSWDELNPFERWKNSPPENEPASIHDIANAVANSELPSDAVSSSPSSISRRGKGSSNGSSFSVFRAPSTTSQETGRTSSLSASSAAFSQNSSNSAHGSFGSFSSSLAGKKDRRRRRRAPPPSATRIGSDDKKRIFQCTFCTDTFKSKYDWTRHEKSLHLSLEKWICAPLGPIVTDLEGGQSKCVYCDLHNPSSDHIESHNHRQCENKGLDSRTFFRKDHLRQHLRLMHGCEMTKPMDEWKSTATHISSRCGFCSQRFTIWQERIDHLTAHFKAGARMLEWKGCRGLDPDVAALVTNAMPPYLIGIESVSPNPFSATNRATWRQSTSLNEGESADNAGECGLQATRITNECDPTTAGSKATCWEILTLRLGKYAREMARQGITMTDEMLQSHARRVLYDSDDTWNQTAADNPEWLDLFKKAHGLDFIPTTLGGKGSHVPEDAELYGDLGLRIPFEIQLQAYNRSQQQAEAIKTAGAVDPLQESIEQRRKELQDIYSHLAREGVLYSDEQKCAHTECAVNVIDFSSVDGASATGYSPKRWCNRELSPEKAAQMAASMAKVDSTAKALDSAHVEQRENFAAGEHRFACLLDRIYGTGSREPAEHGAISSDRAVGNANQEPSEDQLAYRSANARARSLAALARAEVPLCNDQERSRPRAAGREYLRRHKLELPKDRLHYFATATGPWQDSGLMPEAFDTSLVFPAADSISISTPQTSMSATSTTVTTNSTTTGAMMEFLGGNVGQSLSFRADPVTSQLTIPDTAAITTDELQWDLPNADADGAMGAMEGDEALMEQLDELIRAATTTNPPVEQVPAPVTAPSPSRMDLSWIPATTGDHDDVDMDTAMQDFDFDDLTFDGVFDMPLDETFGPADGAV